jgi:RimJ/RimL family protein N-acetyltransferase
VTARARIRPLRRHDGELLDRVIAGMSAQSRYRRFHGPKPRLTSADRAHLTNVDERDHIALIALAPDGAPVAVARAVRLQEDPAAAELGVEVVDAWQHQGLGTEMTTRLARRAAAVGIERLVARVLHESGLGRDLRRRGWRTVERDGPSVVLVADAWAVARTAAPRSAGPLRRGGGARYAVLQ